MLCISNQHLQLMAIVLGFTTVPSYGEDVGSHEQITQKNYEDEQLPSCRRGSYLDAASNKCIQCTRGQNYMSDDYNRQPSCVKCSTCPTLMELVLPCEESYDSVCRCVRGFRITLEGLCTNDRSVKKITSRPRTVAVTTQIVTDVSHTEDPVNISTTRSDVVLTDTLLMSRALPFAEETQVADTQQLEYLYSAILGLLILIILLLTIAVGSFLVRRQISKHFQGKSGLAIGSLKLLFWQTEEAENNDSGIDDSERNALIAMPAATMNSNELQRQNNGANATNPDGYSDTHSHDGAEGEITLETIDSHVYDDNEISQTRGFDETAAVSKGRRSNPPTQQRLTRRDDAVQGIRHLHPTEQQTEFVQVPHSSVQMTAEDVYDVHGVPQTTGSIETPTVSDRRRSDMRTQMQLLRRRCEDVLQEIRDLGLTEQQTDFSQMQRSRGRQLGDNRADEDTLPKTVGSNETSTVVNDGHHPIAPTHNLRSREEVLQGIRGLRLTQQQNVFLRGPHFRGELPDSPPESAPILEEPNDQNYRNQYFPNE